MTKFLLNKNIFSLNMNMYNCLDKNIEYQNVFNIPATIFAQSQKVEVLENLQNNVKKLEIKLF